MQALRHIWGKVGISGAESLNDFPLLSSLSQLHERLSVRGHPARLSDIDSWMSSVAEDQWGAAWMQKDQQEAISELRDALSAVEDLMMMKVRPFCDDTAKLADEVTEAASRLDAAAEQAQRARLRLPFLKEAIFRDKRWRESLRRLNKIREYYALLLQLRTSATKEANCEKLPSKGPKTDYLAYLLKCPHLTEAQQRCLLHTQIKVKLLADDFSPQTFTAFVSAMTDDCPHLWQNDELKGIIESIVWDKLEGPTDECGVIFELFYRSDCLCKIGAIQRGFTVSLLKAMISRLPSKGPAVNECAFNELLPRIYHLHSACQSDITRFVEELFAQTALKVLTNLSEVLPSRASAAQGLQPVGSLNRFVEVFARGFKTAEVFKNTLHIRYNITSPHNDLALLPSQLFFNPFCITEPDKGAEPPYAQPPLSNTITEWRHLLVSFVQPREGDAFSNVMKSCLMFCFFYRLQHIVDGSSFDAFVREREAEVAKFLALPVPLALKKEFDLGSEPLTAAERGKVLRQLMTVNINHLLFFIGRFKEECGASIPAALTRLLLNTWVARAKDAVGQMLEKLPDAEKESFGDILHTLRQPFPLEL